MEFSIWDPNNKFLCHKSVYGSAFLGVGDSEGPKYTVELCVEWGRQQKYTY
jgi:hypothetical protein